MACSIQAFSGSRSQTRRKEEFPCRNGLEAAYLSGFYGLYTVTLYTRTAERSTFIFRVIVSSGKTILEHPDTRSSDATCMFDLHVVVPLYVTGLRVNILGFVDRLSLFCFRRLDEKVYGTL